MKLQRTYLMAVLAALAVAIMLYRAQVFKEPDQAPRPNLVILTGGSGPYWQAIAQGARAAAEDVGADLKVLMPDHDEDVEAQNKLLNSVDTSVVNGVALSPLNAEAQTRLIDGLAANAFVVTVDSDAPLSARSSYVGASNHAAGIQAAQLAREALPEGGKVAVLLANMSKDNMLERKAGFQQGLIGDDDEEAMANDQYDIVGYVIDEGDNKRCARQIRELLDQHSDLACIVGMNARHGPIMVSTLEDAGRLSATKVVAFDTPEATLNSVQQGKISATIAQNPYQYGYEAVRLLASYCERQSHELPPPGNLSTMTISTRVVRQGDVEDFLETSKAASSQAAAALQ